MTNFPDENKEEENNNDQIVLTEEEAEFAEEVSDLIFESALIRYIADESSEKIAEFETFISLNANTENLIEKLYEKYPDFGKILDEETLAMKEEIDSLAGETK